MISDIEAQIHALEQDAYGAVLRALKAQSDALSWDKEELITNLRRELRVSDDEHREVLTKVNADPVLQSIREWRKNGGIGATPHIPPTVDQFHSPAVPYKRHKPSHSTPFVTPSQLTHPQGILDRRPQPMVLPPAPMSYQHTNQGPSSFITTDHSQRTHDPLIGKKVMIRLLDGKFYEATVTQYNPLRGEHQLAYATNSNTPNEWLEWVNLKKIASEDIHWIDDEPGISRQTAGDGQLISRNSQISSRVQIPFGKQVENETRPSQNAVASDIGDEIEILHTDTLLQKVERVIDASHPDLHQLEKAKKMLKDHEQSLLDVISKLADACESSNSDREQQQQSNRQPQLHGQRYNGGANIAPEISGGSTHSFGRGRGHSTPHTQQEEDVVIV